MSMGLGDDWAIPAAAAGKAAGEAAADGTYGGMLKGLKGSFGEESDLGRTLKIFAGAGIVGGLAIAANQFNALAAIAAAEHVGVSPAAAAAALADFKNVKRRMELRGVVQRPEGDITVFDDFAHHPSAIRTMPWDPQHAAASRMMVPSITDRQARVAGQTALFSADLFFPDTPWPTRGLALKPFAIT